MMKDFNNMTKVGLLIQGFATLLMIILYISNKEIGDLVMWIFTIGLALAILGTFISLRQRADKK